MNPKSCHPADTAHWSYPWYDIEARVSTSLWFGLGRLSRLLDAKARRDISPAPSPREPLVTMIATLQHTPLKSVRRNIVRSGTPAQGPEVRSMAARYCHSKG